MSDAARVLLECRELDLRYGARALVRALRWDVRSGERWAVAGPNGAGKSSLLRVLAGAQRPGAGAVEIAGQSVEGTAPDVLAGTRAFVADRWTDPFGFTALETVLAGRFRMRDGAGVGAAAEAAARRILETLECGHLADRDARGLSRGERQRVALAAALAQEAPLLLLDEPVSHQDPRQRGSVLRCLAEFAESGADRAVVGVFHDIDAAVRFATHALLLFGDGTWVAGTAQAVLTRENLSRLFGIPFGETFLDGRRFFVLA